MKGTTSLEWLYPVDGLIPAWVGWLSVCMRLSRIWRWLKAPEREAESFHTRLSGARAVMTRVCVRLSHQGWCWQAHEPSDYSGGTCRGIFEIDFTGLIAALIERDLPRVRPVSEAA